MASTKANLKTRISTLRHEILSYKPGKAVPSDDERVVFPGKLVIGMICPYEGVSNIVPALRRALRGDVEARKRADKRQPSTENQDEYLTDSISLIITRRPSTGSVKVKDVKDLAEKVGCMVLVVDLNELAHTPLWIRMIKAVTGRDPLCAILSIERRKAIEKAKTDLNLGITDIYELAPPGHIIPDRDRLHWLDLIHGCLQEGDIVLAINELKELKLARREVERLQTEMEDERAKGEKEKRSLLAEMTKKLESKQHQVDSLTELLEEKERNETALIQQVEELKKEGEEDRARAEKEKRSPSAEMTKKLESKQHQVDSLTELLEEKERNETSLKQQVEEFKKKGEEDRTTRSDQEKCSLAAQMTREIESKQQRVDTLPEMLAEKERNDTIVRQQVEELKNERKEDIKRFEQLERETWKLRTKIQLESEIRSAEQKKKAETPQWVQTIFTWMNSGKQAQGGTSSSQDNAIGGMGSSDTSQAGEEPPDDEFADILKKIADDLYDGAKIDSLGGQLGILQGDIERALMTNMRFNRVTSDGTRHMLKQWRRGVSREDERMELRNALKAARLLNLAEVYFPQDEAVGVSEPLNQERKELDDREHDDDETMAEDTTEPNVQPDLQEYDSIHANDGNDEILEALDGEMEGDDQASQSLCSEDDDSSALVDTEEPVHEKSCCSWCCCFRYTQI